MDNDEFKLVWRASVIIILVMMLICMWKFSGLIAGAFSLIMILILVIAGTILKNKGYTL